MTATIPERNDPSARERTLNHTETILADLSNEIIKLNNTHGRGK